MPREAPVCHASSFEEFFKQEVRSQVRHEFVDGQVYEKLGGTVQHHDIAKNTLMALKAPIRQVGGSILMFDVLVKTPRGDGYYPDVYVVLKRGRKASAVQECPSIIVERRVLADVTEKS